MRAEIEGAFLAVCERVADELAGIRKALEQATLIPGDEPVSLECQHPEESRVDFSAMGVEEWECAIARGGCGFRHEPALAKG